MSGYELFERPSYLLNQRPSMSSSPVSIEPGHEAKWLGGLQVRKGADRLDPLFEDL